MRADTSACALNHSRSEALTFTLTVSNVSISSSHMPLQFYLLLF